MPDQVVQAQATGMTVPGIGSDTAPQEGNLAAALARTQPPAATPTDKTVAKVTPTTEVSTTQPASSTVATPATPATIPTPAEAFAPKTAAPMVNTGQAPVTQVQYENMQIQNYLTNLYASAVSQGAKPEQANQIVQQQAQALAGQQRIMSVAQKEQALENNPLTRRLAAETASKPYTDYGVTPEMILDAPTPEAMTYAAYSIAKANHGTSNSDKSKGLEARAKNGNDAFDSGQQVNTGTTHDYYKESGKSLLRSALANR